MQIQPSAQLQPGSNWLNYAPQKTYQLLIAASKKLALVADELHDISTLDMAGRAIQQAADAISKEIQDKRRTSVAVNQAWPMTIAHDHRP